jgi:hypothetical protein
LDGNAEGFGETRFQFFSNAWRDGATIDDAQGNLIFHPSGQSGHNNNDATFCLVIRSSMVILPRSCRGAAGAATKNRLQRSLCKVQRKNVRFSILISSFNANCNELGGSVLIALVNFALRNCSLQDGARRLRVPLSILRLSMALGSASTIKVPPCPSPTKMNGVFFQVYCYQAGSALSPWLRSIPVWTMTRLKARAPIPQEAL